MSVLENAQQLQQMMAENKTMEAFDKFYHDEVKVVEVPTGETRNGKEAQREAINQWYNSVEEFHDGGCNSICANEDQQTSTAETWMDITLKDGGRMKMSEVAVQKWKDGQIIEEKFYYNMPQQ